MSIYLSTYLHTHLSIYLSIHLFVCISTYMDPPADLCLYLSMYLSIYLSIYLYRLSVESNLSACLCLSSGGRATKAQYDGDLWSLCRSSPPPYSGTTGCARSVAWQKSQWHAHVLLCQKSWPARGSESFVQAAYPRSCSGQGYLKCRYSAKHSNEPHLQ